MKANELRIGNWVLINGSATKVNSIDESGWINSYLNESSRERHIELTEVEPIPLTPEILEKCGFEYDKIDHVLEDEIELYKRAEFTLLLENNQFVYCEWGEYVDRIGIPLTSLHQLQNLYFCLTGEELIVNL